MTIRDVAESKHVYVVIGIGRSGTSAISSGLNAVGVEFGEALKPGDHFWNPKGFWEDVDIGHKVNRRVVEALDYTWDKMNSITSLCHNNPNLTSLEATAVNLINKRMATCSRWGFKDISTVKILPFWQQVFHKANVEDHYVIALRHPLATAHSYHRVEKVDIELGLILWLVHLIPAINDTRHKNRMMVSYESLLQQPRIELERMQKKLGLSPVSSDAVNAYCDKFLDKELQHYQYQLDDLSSHPATSVAPLCKEAYALLIDVAHDKIDLESEVFAFAWNHIQQEFAKILPVYSYIETLLRKHKNLQREMRAIHKSIPWRLMSPWIKIENAWHAYRKKMRTCLLRSS